MFNGNTSIKTRMEKKMQKDIRDIMKNKSIFPEDN